MLCPDAHGKRLGLHENVPSVGGGSIVPQIKGGYAWGNVRKIFPDVLAEALEEGILAFDKKIPGAF